MDQRGEQADPGDAESEVGLTRRQILLAAAAGIPWLFGCGWLFRPENGGTTASGARVDQVAGKVPRKPPLPDMSAGGFPLARPESDTAKLIWSLAYGSSGLRFTREPINIPESSGQAMDWDETMKNIVRLMLARTLWTLAYSGVTDKSLAAIYDGQKVNYVAGPGGHATPGKIDLADPGDLAHEASHQAVWIKTDAGELLYGTMEGFARRVEELVDYYSTAGLGKDSPKPTPRPGGAGACRLGLGVDYDEAALELWQLEHSIGSELAVPNLLGVLVNTYAEWLAAGGEELALGQSDEQNLVRRAMPASHLHSAFTDNYGKDRGTNLWTSFVNSPALMCGQNGKALLVR